MTSITRLLFFILTVMPAMLFAQSATEINYFKKHPEALPQLDDYAEMIGQCQCKSVRRNADGTWPDTTSMTWQFKYILGGTAVQDETWKADGTYTSSVRQFHPDSARWVVTYYSSSSPSIPASWWTGKERQGNQLLLYRPQKAPNGMDGYSRLKFYDISEEGYNWIGEWVSMDESFTFPFWKIYCKKLD